LRMVAFQRNQRGDRGQDPPGVIRNTAPCEHP
jgi:hypothetical protein